jgi:hypothetical protein
MLLGGAVVFGAASASERLAYWSSSYRGSIVAGGDSFCVLQNGGVFFYHGGRDPVSSDLPVSRVEIAMIVDEMMPESCVLSCRLGLDYARVVLPLWLMLAAASAILGCGALILRRRPERDGGCPSCHYPVSGLRGDRCPECGKPIPSMPACTSSISQPG